MSRWNLDPPLLGLLAFAAFAYVGVAPARSPAQRMFFAAGFAVLVLGFVSPLCALSSALFSARVVHHVLLSVVAAPCLVYAFAPGRLKFPGSPALWTAVHAGVFWAWHAPAAYGWALSNDAVYWVMQATLLGTALAFWAAVRRASAPAAVAGLLAVMVSMGLLGALLTFAAEPLYAPHLFTTAAWGLSPLVDQQLAGLIMWAPAAGVYLIAALVLLGRWLGPDVVAETAL